MFPAVLHALTALENRDKWSSITTSVDAFGFNTTVQPWAFNI